MIDFTDAVASLGPYEALTGACAAAAAANTNRINALSAAVRIFNFDYTDREKIGLQRRTVLELLAVVLVALAGAARATLGEPSRGNHIGQRSAARIDRPGAAIDGSLIENPAAASAGESEPRAATRSNRLDSANLPVVRSPRRQILIAHINSWLLIVCIPTGYAVPLLVV